MQNSGVNCKLCQKPDDSQMVCCDICDQWFHFQCVNVTSSIENVDWQCSQCSAAGNVSLNVGNDAACGGGVLSDNVDQTQVRSHISNGAVPKAPRQSSISSSSSRGDKSAKARRLQAEAMLLEEEQRILRQREVLLTRRRKLLQREEVDDDSDPEEGLNVTAVQKWLNATGITLPTSAPRKTPTSNHQPPSRQQANPPIARQRKEALDDDNVQRDINLLMQKLSLLEQQVRIRPTAAAGTTWLPNLMPEVAPVSQNIPSPTGKPVAPLHDRPCLTTNQLAARKGLSKELPKFDGKPEEWPLFVATFQQTTELCGFSMGENLLRLRQALEGPARNAVRNLLLHASCVPQIIDTLQMKFGRPELIIRVLIGRIRDIPPVRDSRLETLVDLALEVQNVCATMKASNMLCHLNNPELEQELVGKLPGLLAAFWGMHKLQLSTCNLESFGNWLFQLAQGANNVIVPSNSSKTNTKRGYLNAHINDIDARSITCGVCFGDCASVEGCKKFQGMSRSERWKLVRVQHLCRRCLKTHRKFSCSSTTVCNVGGCKLAHHPLLHSQVPATSRTVLGNSPVNAHTIDANAILFQVLPVTLYGNNRELKTYAFFDDGSSLTLMDAELQTSLNIRGTPQPLCLKWTSNAHRYENESRVLDLEISGSNSGRRFTLRDVRTVQRLELPRQTIDAESLQARFAYLKGVPLSSYTEAVPKLLIGLNNSRLGLSLKVREGSIDEPVAEKTRLGWTLKGPLSKHELPRKSGYHAFHACSCDTAELMQIVKDYICLDNLDIDRRSEVQLSVDDQYAVEQLKSTTKCINCRYETGLLWKRDRPSHPDSLPMALRRARCLQAKLKRDPELASTLSTKVSAYVTKGYAKQLPTESLTERKCWYLPIFPVYNPNKPGKVRIVWDAAAKTNDVSLNSMLLKGPDQLTCLVSVLRRFRQRAIAVSGDIEEMFHQIRIRSSDQNYQRFLWLDPDATEPVVFAMTVMTFGATCSPSSAQYVKNVNAEQFRDLYPRAVHCIVNNHYVDDKLDSVDTIEEAIRLAKEVSLIHAQGGFNIRNWRSNSTEVLMALKTDYVDSEVNFSTGQEIPAEKILGLWWLSGSDCFTFRVSQHHHSLGLLRADHHPTKREILRIVMSVFDPLGLLGFFVIYAKVVLQEIWRSGCGWDEEIHEQHRRDWLKWIELFPKIEALHIPRCYFKHLTSESVLELHVFVDSSENAFAAVCYLRHSLDNAIHCTLVGSKTKVAPLKMLSIPRLELQAAVTGARLAASVINSHTLPIKKSVFWTDSRTVLSWIRSDHRRYSQFVAFRVSEILELTEAGNWRWVPSAENVADDATKWQNTPKISSESRWFHGPEFLKCNPKQWPSDIENTEITGEELRAKYVGLHDHTRTNFQPLAIHPRFSRWSRLLRVTAVVALVARTWKSYRRSGSRLYELLSNDDFKSAQILLWKEAQIDIFADEISLLAKGKKVECTSPIYKLSPYLDEDSLLRLEGRVKLLGRQDLIILPKDHNITKLIVLDYHVKYSHSNSETVVNEIRQLFWIPRLRVLVNKVRRECQICRNYSASPQPPKMSPLPAARLAPFSRPFSYVGVDYFGPISVAIRRSTEKRYGVLLTCLTTRAVHIEIAHSLSSDSCIIAIRNFMARRGTPLEFWSDNATNFKATQRELSEAFIKMDKSKIVSTFTTSYTRWKFIPPASPHMGGAWERLVRSVKNTLTWTLQSSRPSDEQLRGALMEVEAIINSRPLTYIPLNHQNDEALTPNHFLLGSSSGMKPLSELVNEPSHMRKGWRYAQQVADMFWGRWLREYLPVITRRTKWLEEAKPIEEGDLVYIVDPNGPRNCWPKGRVISVKKGFDGQVRSALVKTCAGTYERPATKLAVLSLRDSDGEVDLADIPGGSVTKDTAAP